jgi:hypothetical protein
MGILKTDYDIHKKKYAGLTIIVDFNEFVYADREEKASLVAKAILQGVSLLQTRLYKSKVSIDDLVMEADRLLKKYII